MAGTFAPLDPAAIRDVVQRALAEDIGRGDVTTAGTVDRSVRARGIILVKSACTLAGLPVAEETFRQVNAATVFKALRVDGDACEPGTIAAEVRGAAASLLTAERTALNFLQRLSGIATITRRFVDAAAGRITILDTRKTTPTLRVLEKYAVRAGGGTNHRGRLDDGILIKDNHVRLAGGVRQAVAKMRSAGLGMSIEVEAQNLDEVDAALDAGADIILLDNLSLEETREAVRRIGRRAQVELSGGVTLARIPELADTGADFVSVGALTHSAQAADLSFELELDA